MLLLIDKPQGMTSHDVVDVVRKITGVKKVGHAGTLDPNATGLLVVGVGREETRKLGNISKSTTKVYEAEVVLGEERTTDDVEGTVISQNSKKPTIDEVKEVLSKYSGEIEQIPPVYSAIKRGGKVAYKEARKGKALVLKPRNVVIHSIELVDYKYPLLKITTKVSSGTYIRALARDIGKSLGTGAYLRNLRRTNIGSFDISNSLKLEEIEKHVKTFK